MLRNLCLCAPDTPIELQDDGMRLVTSGKVRGADYQLQANPELIAHVVALKKVRSLVREHNIRHFS